MNATRMVRTLCLVALLTLVASATVPKVQAATVNLGILADNSIFGYATHINSNAGAWQAITIGNNGLGTTRGLLRFSTTNLQAAINNLNPGETLQVTGIQLTLYVSDLSGTNKTTPSDAAVYQLRADGLGNNTNWVEGTGGGSVPTALAGESAWSFKTYNTVNWYNAAGLGSPGGGYVGYDSSPISYLATQSFTGAQKDQTGEAMVWTFSGTVTDLNTLTNGWLANANGANLLVRQNNEATTNRILAFSREGAVGANSIYAPKLTITYDVVLVPEPSTFAMLLFGSAMMWLVRSKRSA